MNTKKLPRIPFSYKTIEQLLIKNATLYSQKEAIVSFDVDTSRTTTLTYNLLLERVYQTADFLWVHGIRAGRRFAILMHNTPEILIFELAGALVGASSVPLDYRRDTLEQKIYKLNQTGAQALFSRVGEENPEEEKQLLQSLPKLRIIKWKNFEEFEKMIDQNSSWVGKTLDSRGSGKTFFGDLPAGRQAFGYLSQKTHDSRRLLDSPYVILYTSGTTAHPKGAILTQRACLLNALGIADWQKFGEHERFMVIMPLHHINSTIFCLSILLSGGTIILVSRYSASTFWEIASKFKVTNSSIVPTILHDQLEKVKEFESVKGALTLKRICIGSAPVLPEETLKFYKTFGIRVIQGYGQTETALRVAGVPVDLSEKDYVEAVKTNTIGLELANNHLAIMKNVNHGKGRPANASASAGEEGEICIQGPVLAQEYLKDHEATKKAFKNGWFHSGDLGKYILRNGQKWYNIIGRIKEIIIKGGVNLSPSAIEDALLKNFSEIQEVAVVGIPDQRMGEEIGAVVVINEKFKMEKAKLPASPAGRQLKIKNLIENKKIEGIAEYEIPKYVFFMESLPKTSTGKIQRVVIKKMVNELISGGLSGSGKTFFGDLPAGRQAFGYLSQKTHASRTKSQNVHSAQETYLIRQIKPSEKEILREAAEIESMRFGLSTTGEIYRQRAKNGLVFGAFEGEKLAGTISCLRSNLARVKKLKTWNEATSKGTLSNNDQQGDTLVCIAISVVSKNPSSFARSHLARLDVKNEGKLGGLAKRHIKTYVESGQDHVLSFHQKPKGGLEGAKAWKILEGGRREDQEAMGYNVLMKYPIILHKHKIVISPSGSPSILLIEKALDHAQKSGIKHVIAFSRPAGFREYLKSRAST